jgi:mono/diheme cytochrome c family protein
MTKLWMGLGLAAVLGLAMLPAAARAAGDAAKGKSVFELNCASCHGTSGKGDGPTGVALAAQGTHPRDFTKADFKYDTDKDGKAGTDADLANVIKNGAGAYGGSPLMAPWGHLGDATIQDLIAHIRTFHP